MSGPFQPVTGGQPFRVYADEWNALLALLEKARKPDRAVPTNTDGTVVRLQNNSGRELSEKAILAIEDDSLFSSTDSKRDFLSYPTLSGQIPANVSASLAHRTWAVTHTPMSDGEIGNATIGGAAAVRVKINSAHHHRVSIINGDTFKLESSFHGTGRLLHKSELIDDAEAVGPIQLEDGEDIELESAEPVELEQGANADVYWCYVEFPHFDEIEMKATAADVIVPGGSGPVNIWQGGISTGEQETAYLDWAEGTSPIAINEEIWVKWLPDARIWSIRRSEASVQTFIKIKNNQSDCTTVLENGQCVFPAVLVTYHGSTTNACGTWTETGIPVYATAMNHCDGTNQAKEGDIYPAYPVGVDFIPPAQAPAPLYAFRLAKESQTTFIKITNPGTTCDEVEENVYCFFEGKLVTYHGGIANDACGDWTEGADVFVTSVNRCGVNKVKIGDQFPAWLVAKDFDSGGTPTPSVRDLYAIRAPEVSQAATPEESKWQILLTVADWYDRGGGASLGTSPLVFDLDGSNADGAIYCNWDGNGDYSYLLLDVQTGALAEQIGDNALPPVEVQEDGYYEIKLTGPTAVIEPRSGSSPQEDPPIPVDYQLRFVRSTLKVPGQVPPHVPDDFTTALIGTVASISGSQTSHIRTQTLTNFGVLYENLLQYDRIGICVKVAYGGDDPDQWGLDIIPDSVSGIRSAQMHIRKITGNIN